MSRPEGPVGQIQRGIFWLAAATIALVLAVLAVAAVGWIVLDREINRNDTARDALCAQRHDLDQRIVVQTALVQSHHGQLVFGIPRKLIVSGLRRDQTTRQNLEILDCKEAP